MSSFKVSDKVHYWYWYSQLRLVVVVVVVVEYDWLETFLFVDDGWNYYHYSLVYWSLLKLMVVENKLANEPIEHQVKNPIENSHYDYLLLMSKWLDKQQDDVVLIMNVHCSSMFLVQHYLLMNLNQHLVLMNLLHYFHHRFVEIYRVLHDDLKW